MDKNAWSFEETTSFERFADDCKTISNPLKCSLSILPHLVDSEQVINRLLGSGDDINPIRIADLRDAHWFINRRSKIINGNLAWGSFHRRHLSCQLNKSSCDALLLLQVQLPKHVQNRAPADALWILYGFSRGLCADKS